MNELKPEDVMRALELCNTPRSGVCKICPYHEFGASCHTKRNADAIALLREKDAEIERLNDTLADALVRAEIARFEAITEFLERAKTQAREMGDLKPFITIEDLEKIAKEIRGEQT